MFSINHMKIIYSTLTLAAALNSAIAFAKDGERSMTFQEDVSQAELIKLHLPVGLVVISGTTGTSLTAVVTVSCQKKEQKNCYELLEELDWSKKIGRTTTLALTPSAIKNYNDVSMEIKIGVPENKKLKVDLGAGELRIEGTSACLTADVNAGEINIKLKEDQLASAELDADIGEVELTTANGEATQGDRSLLVGAELEWNEGTGNCHTEANVLVGEVSLSLN